MKNVEKIQEFLDNKRRGDYINLKGKTNQILNANVFDKDDYDYFYNNEDEWVKGGNMVSPEDVKDNDIVVTYYGLNNDGAEDSFIVGNPNQEKQQQALNKFVEYWRDFLTVEPIDKARLILGNKSIKDKELAQKVGVSRMMINNYRNGVYDLDKAKYEIVKALADFYDETN
ncbi:XRE family transcriptional regulator [Companilactobacillus suantsaicola]|uniref:XRE family transcriptional regulator n=1 Tax=Companilactobacillus suantsaicola TaxID=2487723 RepID=A0A4Z0JN61_9LACO|nr:helix-turn-helix transcriptional regulator [Companilactobacillus suantsaicola]TGD24333.1 XRE family transcriptional regulator [Companilactobacillus suantsaicola]